MKTFLLVTIISCAMLTTALSAKAQSNWCGNYNEVVKKLKKTYGEQTVNRALSSSGHITEVFTSPDGETWTIIRVLPGRSGEKIACWIDSGEAWVPVNPDTGPKI